MADNHISLRKRRLRQQCARRRREQPESLATSRHILSRLIGLPEYHQARTVSTYVSVPGEVQTGPLIQQAWDDGKQVAVPCCISNHLELFLVKSISELAPRTRGILEPRADFQYQPERWLTTGQIDLFVVPGLAFDRLGGRLGYGKGYYDRLLAEAPAAVPRIALAFACQLIAQVPVTSHDVPMQMVITQEDVYRV